MLCFGLEGPEQQSKGGRDCHSLSKRGRVRLDDGDTCYGMGDKSHAIESEDQRRDISGAKNLTEVFQCAVHRSTHRFGFG